jgi:hypothetical protein
MKFLAVLFIALPVLSFSQDCKIKRTTDPYTKEVRLSTGLIELQSTSLAIEADSKEIDFFFSMTGSEKCFSDESTAVVVYEGTKLKGNFKNGGAVNCDGFFHIIFRNTAGTNTLLQRLISQKIASIQFTGNNKSQITVSFTPEDQQAVMTKGDCLVKEAKTLLKPAN